MRDTQLPAPLDVHVRSGFPALLLACHQSRVVALKAWMEALQGYWKPGCTLMGLYSEEVLSIDAFLVEIELLDVGFYI